MESTDSVPFHSFVPLPHCLPQGLPHCCWTPNHGWVLLGVGTLPLPQPPLRGAGPRGPAFTFAPIPSLPLPQDPLTGEGLGGQRIRHRISAGSWGPKWAGETWPHSLLILCSPSGSPISPFGRWIPSPSPATLQGHQSCSASTSPPPSLPHAPYLVAGGSSHSLRCPWSPTGTW